MSERALEIYTQSREAQLTKNEARRIRTKVREARSAPDDATARWPFELLQNALDSGPREGRGRVEVALRQNANGFVFEHDGAFFNATDLAALLSGGSSKEFDGHKTTGRFGTGFLVTHVLASQVQLSGLLNANGQIEKFELTLDRSGDEDEIVRNIESCSAAIRLAELAIALETLPSARFSYPRDDICSLDGGIRAFRQSLPYLFATCPTLGRVQLQLPGGDEIWDATDSRLDNADGRVICRRAIRVTTPSTDAPIEYESIRVGRAHSGAAAIAVVQQGFDRRKFIVPPENFPRIFCKYPVRTSGFLQMNAILDAEFELDQERRRVQLGEHATMEQFEECLWAAERLLDLAYTECWDQKHLLGRVGPCERAFSDEGTDVEPVNSRLGSLATKLAHKRLVETESGAGPAIIEGDGWCVDFIAPPIESDALPVDLMWSLAAEVEDLDPPQRAIASDWSDIALGWSKLGVRVTFVTLEGIAASARSLPNTLAGMRLRRDPIHWLAQFIDCVGQSWVRRGAVAKALLDNILPNQKGSLCSGPNLGFDQAASEELKDIAAEIGIDVRELLLDRDLVETLSKSSMNPGLSALREVVDGSYEEDDIIGLCVDHLRSRLPDGEAVPAGSENLIAGTIRLLEYLWVKRGEGGKEIARNIPLIMRDRTARCVHGTQRLLVSVSCWPLLSRQFADIFPPQLVVADEYGTSQEGREIADALSGWGICYPSPLVSQTIGGAELKKERLKPIVIEPDIVLEDLSLPETTYSQIALLAQVIPYVGEAPEKARLLLGFILAYVVPTDPSWRMQREITARRGDEIVELRVRPALWLGDIFSRPWVPIELRDEEGDAKLHTVIPDLHVVRPILKQLPSEWYAKDEATLKFLGEFLQFDALELRLQGVSDDALRASISDHLANIVATLGPNPNLYEQLAAELEAKKVAQAQRERFLNLGRAVEKVVKAALESLNLKVDVIDCGYDFEVMADAIEDASMELKIGSVLLEVKTTTTDRARMTPKQASTAAARASEYALCVVDLRGVAVERLDEMWTEDDIYSRARITTDIGERVRGTWYLVEQARTNEVRISGETTLRYEVPSAVWENGLEIRKWVEQKWG